MARGTPGLTSAGGIFRVHDGYAIASFAIPLGPNFAHEVELLAVIFAIEKAWSMRLSLVWFESDSLYVVRLLHSKSSLVPWSVRKKWERCLHFLDAIQFHVSHVFREGNAIADKFSTLAISLTSES